MEHLIARLLKDFERGAMNRRQLIQSLALAATAVSAVGSAVAEAAEGKGFKTLAVNHISYQVKDYRVARDFYADLMGMKVLADNGTSECHMTFGDSFLIPRNFPVKTAESSEAKAMGRVDHIAYTIANWNKNEVEAELKRRGLAPRADTENSFHITDPDGFDLQISGIEMKA
jgi:catechol 2,3-dioxygenase-like lactoylglutathione lyase family enzyme